MLMLKLQRRGKKKQAAYRLIAGEKRTKLGGKQTDDLGWYDPHSSKHELNKDRIHYWLKNGAKMTPTVNNILVGAGIVEGKKIPKHKLSNKPGESNPEAAKAEE